MVEPPKKTTSDSEGSEAGASSSAQSDIHELAPAAPRLVALIDERVREALAANRDTEESSSSKSKSEAFNLRQSLISFRTAPDWAIKAVELGAVIIASGAAIWAILETRGQFDKSMVETRRQFRQAHSATQEQVKLAHEQNTKVQTQIEQQAEQDAIARKAELFATLYDRKESCPDDKESFCPKDECEESELEQRCPIKASLRAREEAVRALVQIERARNPLPDNYSASPHPISLSQLDLRNAVLTNIDLIHADLSRSQLDGTDLSGAQLNGANLSEAQLNDANLHKAQLNGANLSEAQLDGANLFETMFDANALDPVALDRACAIYWSHLWWRFQKSPRSKSTRILDGPACPVMQL